MNSAPFVWCEPKGAQKIKADGNFAKILDADLRTLDIASVLDPKQVGTCVPPSSSLLCEEA